MSDARAQIREFLTGFYIDPKTCGERLNWGEQQRFKGRFAEFGLPDDYAVAVELVDLAISLRFAPDQPGQREPASAASPQRAVSNRMTACSNPVTNELADSEAARLALDSSSDPVAWEACVQLVHNALVTSQKLPYSLRVWTAGVVRGDLTPPSKGISGPFQEPRNEAIFFAVGLALESGAFKAATHRVGNSAPGLELKGARAKSACDLVAHHLRESGVGVALSYPQVALLWGARNRR